MRKRFFYRLVEYIITFLFIITLNFFIPRLMPGDPFTFLSSSESLDTTVVYTQEQISKYKEYYGLNKPLKNQYKDYVINIFKGNLGYSIYYDDYVSTIIKKRIVWTFSLVIISLIISSVLGTIFGSISAWNRNKNIDKLMYFIFMFISEIPSFLIGLLFLFILAGKFRLFPLSGAISSFQDYSTSFDKFKDIAYHAVMPISTLSLVGIGRFYLISRNSMIEILSKDYMITAKAKGLKTARKIFRHALKNSILPVITRIFLGVGSMAGGAILVENVFNYPGLGEIMKEAVFLRDYPLIQGIFIVITFSVLVMNFIADLVYKKLDPRVK